MAKCEKNLEDIFHQASEISDAAERIDFLEEACAGDHKLKTEVEFLLTSDGEAGDFMEVPAVDPNSFAHIDLQTEGPGTVIGHYKLLEKIGEGGMAVVYMAKQQYPIRRKVALKLVKLGMESQQVIARFEAERQALAIMDHPHIAQVFDAGTTASGRPFFVMELVRGMSITKFCDKKRLNTQERLKLFVCVCQAVHHAHRKGIIHRDIKPSNVLVTLHDGQPVPKVIDFGIAKATNHRLTDKTLFTHYAQIIGTPEYMSPEQAELSDLDVDTRTDVYALGALLYELLTGKPPFEVDYLRSKAYGEIQRIIREEEPTKPSTKISTLGEALLDIADVRATTPDALHRLMRADLDWIVMKALEKDRARRYDSARDLTLDIERHLKNEPVLAGPPSTLYSLKKYVRRHRTSVIATAMVATTMLIGLCVSSILFSRVRYAMHQFDTLEAQVETDQHLADAQRLHAQGSYRFALAKVEPLTEESLSNDKAQLLCAQILFDLDRQDEAKTRLEPLTSAAPEIAGTAHYLLSQIMLRTDPAQAKWHRERADDLTPTTEDAYTQRALAEVTPNEAQLWLDRALQQNPSHYTAREARALLN